MSMHWKKCPHLLASCRLPTLPPVNHCWLPSPPLRPKHEEKTQELVKLTVILTKNLALKAGEELSKNSPLPSLFWRVNRGGNEQENPWGGGLYVQICKKSCSRSWWGWGVGVGGGCQGNRKIYNWRNIGPAQKKNWKNNNFFL